MMTFQAASQYPYATDPAAITGMSPAMLAQDATEAGHVDWQQWASMDMLRQQQYQDQQIQPIQQELSPVDEEYRDRLSHFHTLLHKHDGDAGINLPSIESPPASPAKSESAYTNDKRSQRKRSVSAPTEASSPKKKRSN
jgi:hypothetical protein